MIRNIIIHNFKSITELEIPLGRVNVLIGANGAGKSNILEALALSAAAADDKLDSEFLASRGIRVPSNPQFMRAAFDKQSVEEDIELDLKTENDLCFKYSLHKDNADPYSPWINGANNHATARGTRKELAEALTWEFGGDIINALPDLVWTRLQPKLRADITDEQADALRKSIADEVRQQQFTTFEKGVASVLEKHLPVDDGTESPLRIGVRYTLPAISRFLIYSPEYSRLRIFDDETQIQPLGIRGEGLFRLLRVLSDDSDHTKLSTIRETLGMFDWFDDLRVPDNLLPTERRLEIRDRFLDETLAYFDQRSSSEGFLFVLFYLCLFLSEDTSRFFAIDNIDTSLNPKLCTQLMIEISRLAASQGKQVIATTHNPAILDGLNLNDDEQRLFVVSRNKNGFTRVRRVPPPRVAEGAAPVRLSEAYIRGYLGGLPNTF